MASKDRKARFTPFHPRIVSSTSLYRASFTHFVTKMNVYQLAQRSTLPLTAHAQLE